MSPAKHCKFDIPLTSTLRPVLLLESAASKSPYGVPGGALRPRVIHLVAPPRGGNGLHPRRKMLGRLRRGELLQSLGGGADLDGGDVADVVVIGV